MAEHIGQERLELVFAHFAGRHGELTMLNLAESADMSVDGHVIGRVGKDELSLPAGHQLVKHAGIRRIAADQAMVADLPDIAGLRHSRAGRGFGRRFFLISAGSAFEQKIDFAHFESGQGEVETEVHAGKFAEFQGQQVTVPAGLFGKLVVGEDVGPLLRIVQMAEFEHRNFGPAEQLCRFDAAMPGNDAEIFVHENRIVEAEFAD